MYIKIIDNEELSFVVKTLGNLKFTDEQIKKFVVNIGIILNKLDTLEESYKSYHEEMVKRGYSEYQIHELASAYPSVIYFKFCRGHLKPLHKEFLNSVPREQEVKEDADQEILEKLKIVINLGVSEKRIRTLFLYDSLINSISKDELLSNIAFYRSCGLSDKDISYMENRCLRFLEYGAEYYKETLEKLPLFGIDRETFGRMCLKAAKLYFTIDKDSIGEMMDWALSKPLDYMRFGESFAKTVKITCYTKDYFDDKFDNLIKLGFSEDEAGYIISMAGSVLTMGYDNLKEKYDVPSKFGISDEDTRKIIIGCPIFFTLSADNLTEKFRTYKKRNLIDYVLLKPKSIQQGAELTDARALYILVYYPNFSYDTYGRSVFTSEKHFEKLFKQSDKNLKRNVKSLEYLNDRRGE